ncbi:DUF58 domain-containing protein [Pseudactinotalea suaedae]|uniref:DUF58 domain-containing protein n=1 Tax=Pseudactinotalea suaedae TaxID=1524924 RepID=UPI0012E307E7|nr:DUF58 domain-containing protein [Pseudactinotalea suaedae]
MSAPNSATRQAAAITPGLPEGTGSMSRAVTGLVAGVARSRTAISWVSRAGWVVLITGVVSLGVGLRLGWVELIVLGGALLTLVVGAIAFAIGRHPYQVQLRLREGRVVVGERAMGALEVTNVSHRSVLPARIELPVGTAKASFALPTLAGGAEHDELFAIPTERRGVITVGPVSSVRGDPVGLIRRAVLWTEPEELYVHPRTIKIGGSAAGFLHDLEGRETREITNADLSFHALREYVPGDDRRYVHWRSSARTGTLMVRQFEETRRSHLVLGLSVHEQDYGHPDEMELAISAIGSLGLHAIRSESDLTAMTTEEVLPHRSPRQLLDGLTRIEANRNPTSIVDLGRTIARDVQRATVVLLAFGSTVTPDHIRTAGAVLPTGVRALAIRASLGEDSELAARRLGNVTVLTLPTLEELPRGFRKVER